MYLLEKDRPIVYIHFYLCSCQNFLSKRNTCQPQIIKFERNDSEEPTIYTL